MRGFGKPAKKVKRGTFRRLLKNLLNHKIRLMFISISIIISATVNAAASVFIKILIDDYITPLLLQDKNNVDYTEFIKAMFVFIMILITGAIFSFTYHLLMVKLSNGILRDIREQMYRKMQHFPLKYFDTNKAGDIMSRYTNDLDTFRQVLSQAIPDVVGGSLVFIVVFACMLYLSINLFAIVLIMCFVMVLFAKFIGKMAVKSYRDTQKSVGGLNSYVEEMVLGAKEVKVYCYEKRNIDIFNGKNEEWKNAVRKADMVSNCLMPFMNSIGNIMYVILAFVGGFMMVYNIKNLTIFGTAAMTIGTISSFLSFAKMFAGRIGELSSQIPFILQSLSGAERIFDLIDNEVEIDRGNVTLTTNENNELYFNDNDRNIKTRFEGEIVLKDVNFSYDGTKQILKNINVYAKKGEKVALVGATGAGKTTITNLINRFYEVDSGSITIDSINVKEIRKYDLRNCISLVLQDVQLFSGTIMDNIRYGKLDASDAECIAAAKLAFADTFIEMLPDGYNTVIKGDSGRLSQGQKQLISIARTAVANPPCLILDEATSSIDTRTEKLVQKGIESIMKGRTVFIIAHRLSTIKDADVIMVMNDGEIIERGNHESLIEKKGRYYELYTGKVEMD